MHLRREIAFLLLLCLFGCGSDKQPDNKVDNATDFIVGESLLNQGKLR